MTAFAHRLRALALALGLTAGLPVAGMAACADLETMTPGQLGRQSIETVQTGVRAALNDNSRWLRDGFLGGYTRRALAQLCAEVPRLGETGDIPGTLELAAEYAGLTGLMPDWRRAMGSPVSSGILNQIDALKGSGGPINMPLRLAGTPRMTVTVLQDRNDRFACTDAQAALASQPTAANAVRLLQRRFGAATVAELCEMLPVAGDASDFTGSMARLSRLEVALPGALYDLTSQDFARRVAENSASYHLRLVGSESAVLRLIEDYRAGRRASPGTTGPGTGGSGAPGPASPLPMVDVQPCTLDRSETTMTYFALTPQDIDPLRKQVDLAPILEQFRADNPGFDSADRLWRGLQAALSPAVDACVMDAVRQIVQGAPELARIYGLDPARTDNLMLNAGVQPVMPLLKDFARSTNPDQAALLNGIRQALIAERGNALAAEVEQAAEIMAAATEPEQVIYDVAPEDLTIPELPPAVARVVVTGATDDAVADTITNEQFRKVLAETPFAPATSAALIKGQVRGALRGAAAVQAAEQVDALMTAIAPAVTESWSLTPELEQLIVTNPSIRQAIDNPIAAQLPQWTKTLVGIEYPSLRLFEAALDNAPLPDGRKSTDPLVMSMRERLTMAARKTVPDPDAPRVYGPIATEDCDCVPTRREHGQVYGFYPFWEDEFAAPPPAEEDAAAKPAVLPAPPAPRKVDFGTVGRIAFYGLELSLNRAETAFAADEVQLRHADQWAAAKRSFVNSAHRYRAKADLAIDVWGWQDWSAKNIDDAAALIIAQMQPFPRFEGYRWDQIKAALPTRFDPPQPDGLTLIFRDYARLSGDENATCRITQLISRVYMGMPDQDDQNINIGLDVEFDFANSAEWEVSLFRELDGLLLRGDKVEQMANQQQCDDIGATTPPTDAATRAPSRWHRLGRGPALDEVVDKILLFLQRPTGGGTSGSAQMLRYQMEVSEFRGETLTAALRSIIPIMPPGANRFVGRHREYATLHNDAIYFQDNFGGIGFWPAPRPSLIAGDDPARISAVLAETLGEGPPSAINRWVCGIVCPNRAFIDMGAMALFVILLGLTWRSFYSGVADEMAFRVFTIGLVWIGNIILVLTLVLRVVCDPASTWPLIFLVLLIAALGLILIYNFVERAKNGPKP